MLLLARSQQDLRNDIRLHAHTSMKRTHSGSGRMPQTAAHLPEPEAASPSPLASSQTPITQEVIGHIYGLKHLDDHHILELLRVARHPGKPTSSNCYARLC